MADEKHTPGPWVAVRPRVRWRIMAGEQFVMETDEVRTEADAYLIAAAPDLLAAVKALLAYGAGGEYPPGVVAAWDKAVEDAEAAIAKAEGKA